MRHIVVEEWSRRQSPLHSRDARAKLLVLVVFLIAVSTAAPGAWLALAAFALLTAAAAAVSGLPPLGLLSRAALALPFSATLVLLTWWSGDGTRALTVGAKALLSVLASLLLVATTPVTQLAAALDRLRVPRMLVLVIQFVYRYLFVLFAQGHNMRLAASARQGKAGGRTFRSAAGALSVLFVRSWERAGGIHSAMLARGFGGVVHPLTPSRMHPVDLAFLCIGAAGSILIRLELA